MQSWDPMAVKVTLGEIEQDPASSSENAVKISQLLRKITVDVGSATAVASVVFGRKVEALPALVGCGPAKLTPTMSKKETRNIASVFIVRGLLRKNESNGYFIERNAYFSREFDHFASEPIRKLRI